jgi:hypothetical protein
MCFKSFWCWGIGATVKKPPTVNKKVVVKMVKKEICVLSYLPQHLLRKLISIIPTSELTLIQL